MDGYKYLVVRYLRRLVDGCNFYLVFSTLEERVKEIREAVYFDLPRGFYGKS